MKRTINIGGEDREILFTTWTLDHFYKLTGINLYDKANIAQVFKTYEKDAAPGPEEFALIAKFAYCALASAVMPENADEQWKPPFTWTSVFNKIPLESNSKMLMTLFGAYTGASDEEIHQMLERAKNIEAPQTEGQLV